MLDILGCRIERYFYRFWRVKCWGTSPYPVADRDEPGSPMEDSEFSVRALAAVASGVQGAMIVQA